MWQATVNARADASPNAARFRAPGITLTQQMRRWRLRDSARRVWVAKEAAASASRPHPRLRAAQRAHTPGVPGRACLRHLNGQAESPPSPEAKVRPQAGMVGGAGGGLPAWGSRVIGARASTHTASLHFSESCNPHEARQVSSRSQRNRVRVTSTRNGGWWLSVEFPGPCRRHDGREAFPEAGQGLLGPQRWGSGEAACTWDLCPRQMCGLGCTRTSHPHDGNMTGGGRLGSGSSAFPAIPPLPVP